MFFASANRKRRGCINIGLGFTCNVANTICTGKSGLMMDPYNILTLISIVLRCLVANLSTKRTLPKKFMLLVRKMCVDGLSVINTISIFERIWKIILTALSDCGIIRLSIHAGDGRMMRVSSIGITIISIV